MKPYFANILITLRMMTRDRMVLFFGYVFPLIFFFLFAQMMSAGQGAGLAKQVVTSVLIFGVLGNGFFGAGMRAVSDREQNILRRFKVAPTTAAPLLTGWLLTGWISFIPSALFLIAIGHFSYGMPWPERPATLFIFLTVAVLAFRSIGLIIASVVNSMQESSIIVQLLYLPMLFLSGATFPVTIMPEWLQIVAQFIPASHLYNGLQGILLRQEPLADLWKSILALLLTLAVSMFLSIKLFRWEKEEKVKSSAKLWVLAALAPFLILGVYQSFTKEALAKSKVLQRELRRSRTLLIRDARLFLGDGKIVPRGGILVKNGKIDAVFEGDSPDAKSLGAELIEGSGKTVLPGLIDTNVHLYWPGGVPDASSIASGDKPYERALAAYIFSGVTTLRSSGDGAALPARLARKVASGELLGADVLSSGPLFTSPEILKTPAYAFVPPPIRDRAIAETLRFPATPAAARKQALEAASQGALALEVDSARLSAEISAAVAAVAREKGLMFVSNTELPGADIVSGSPQAPANSSWIPSLVALEAATAPSPLLLDRSLVQQSAPRSLIARTRPLLPPSRSTSALAARQISIPQAANRLLAGSGAGQMFLIHGPAIHRELALLVASGISPIEALQSATGRAATALHIHHRVGFLKKGSDADLLVVDGNPAEDISVTERISLVVFRGERVARSAIFEDFEEEAARR
jgi:imidazolonepropionase-like amidohydrolase/ABC-type polysaccharide/polyol phosphate export permease